MFQAVRENFLSTREDEKTWQLHLANYYQFWCDRPRLKVTYLPLHLKRAEEHNRSVISFLIIVKINKLISIRFINSN